MKASDLKKKIPGRGKPVSGTGAAYICAGLFLSFSGMLRGELAAAVCGFVLLIYALFAFFSVIITFLNWRKTEFALEWISRENAVLSISPDSGKNKTRLFFLAGIVYSVYYTTYPETVYSRTWVLGIPVQGRSTDCSVKMPDRGIYKPKSVFVKVSDFSGFFSFYFTQPDRYYPEQLTVPPVPENPGKTGLPPGISGTATGKSTFKESEELYEIRPYFPGDDPRKINWKVFAHIGDISIRKGELLPPPSSEYFFLFYSPEHKEILSPGKKGRKETAFFSRNYDMLIRRALYTALALSGQNKIVSVITEKTQARPEIISIAPDDPFAGRKISEAFAVPSFRGNTMDLRKIPGLLPENAGLLVFFTPCADKNYNDAALKDFASIAGKKVCLFIGPSETMPEQLTFPEKIRKLFYLSGIEDKTRLISDQEIDRMIAESGKGRMHAEKI